MKTNNKGFSLVELIVVIAIMAILAAVAIPTFATFITKANVASDVSFVNDLTYAAKLAHTATGGSVTNVQVEVDEDGDGERDKMCCGDNGEYFDITRIEGLGSGEGYWYESNGNYRLHLLSATGSSQPLKIYFKTNSGVKINLKKNSSSSNLEWWYSTDIDSELKAYLTNTSFEKTYGVGSEWDNDEHYIFVYAKYLNTSVLNYEVQATFEIGLPCTPFTSYVKLKHQYTEDGTNYKDYEPKEYKYGSIIMSNDPDCGYMPLIDQWVEICKDCTYEDVVTNGVIDSDCARCYSFEGSVSGLYSLQKRQISKDLGKTWEDTMPLETNKFRFLKLGDVCE